MRALIWSNAARRDLFGIAAYYGSLDPGLARELLDRVETAPTILLDYPEMGSPTRHRDVRKWTVPRTPFNLLYTMARGRVEIRRVVHTAMDIRP